MNKDLNKDHRDLTDGKQRETSTTREVDQLERVPLHLQRAQDAYCFKEPGYRYRLVNDIYGRIAKFKKAGWEIVEENVAATYTDLGRAQKTQAASGAWRVVNEGNDAKAKEGVIMRIRLELWEQDQAAKHVEVDSVLKEVDETGQIRKTQILATRGNLPRDAQ